MVVEMRLGSQAQLHCRFAISPINETNEALRSLTHHGRDSYHLPWQRQVRPTLSGLGLGPLLALMPNHSYQPDFMSPPPTGPHSDINADLDRIRSTPPGQVAAEIDRCLRSQSAAAQITQQYPELVAGPDSALELIVELLGRAWTVLIEPWWPRLRDVLDTDITVRGRQLAETGTVATLNDLHPKIQCRDNALWISVGADQQRELTDGAVVLLPSVFAWPGVGVMFDPPWQPTVIYPARGIAQIWQPIPRTTGDLAQLIGTTRATILTALAEPASTTGLAARSQIPISTVSEHLTVLRANGLITTTRTGRSLSHQLTALGVALAAAPDSPPPTQTARTRTAPNKPVG